jgi:hypothetical protein
MRHEQTDAGPHQDDAQGQTRPVVRPGAVARTLAHPLNPSANIRTTVWLIAGLILAWVIIVTA